LKHLIAGISLLFCSISFGQWTNPALIPNRTSQAHDYSGAIAQGGTWQMMAPVDLVRYGLLVENYCSATTQGLATSESIFLSLGTNSPTSLAGAIEISTCGSYRSDSGIVSTNNVWIYANTTGHLFVAKEW
jgi:hypothetical protein